MFIIDKINPVLAAICDGRQLAAGFCGLIEMVNQLGLAVGQAQFPVEFSRQDVMRNVFITGLHLIVGGGEIIDYAIHIGKQDFMVADNQLS
ncbi:hypothetical protein Xsze_02041 [Xenorhabdus szentirmaii DSM 16338]|nr:hypothetical protein Xsze_02041 [Xenorhabdus szentirmaii DSM 16338]